ncbi:MAG: hypothetical protein RMI43_00390 [Candidatus Caldarchaeum sp.]|nr:hypothetical protein [Candidatus Caldarchaeum sp.]MCX8201192.1 hypothetical protein [Candidatus Caldarchaeum sp.]MDW8062611.1 hypothetical protein [Candidatus Caldarchaeum sp.]MDW8435609.1 hypothetical protein [Candidatus Caldarchaeum sp.]
MPRKASDPLSPRYKARIGYEGEYSLLRRFVEVGERGFYAVRTPGSGTGKMPKPDIIAVDKGELLAIEVKSSNKAYAAFSTEQVKRLKDFTERFEISCPHCGGKIRPKPVAAVRFVGRGWRFYDLGQVFDGHGFVVKWEDEHR